LQGESFSALLSIETKAQERRSFLTMQLTRNITLPKLQRRAPQLPRGLSLPSGFSLSRKRQGSAVVGLEIEAGSLGAAEVDAAGAPRLVKAAVGILPPGVFHEGEVVNAEELASSLRAFFAEHKLSKQVRLGIGNQAVVVRTVRLPAIEDPKELDAAIRFQAQEQMPMPLDQAVLEYQVVGGVPAEEGQPPQIDVVLIAARRSMVSAFLQPLRRAGIEPVGVDLSAFGMIRALADLAPTAQASVEDPQPSVAATLYCSVGDVMNIAVARGRSCLFTRASHAGLGAIVARLSADRSLTTEHAAMWLAHTGLETPLEQIEGDPGILEGSRQALEGGVTVLVDELRLSLDYYGAQEGAVPIEHVVLCGPGSAIRGVAARIENGIGLPISPVLPEALGDMDPVTAARLTLPYGLALVA
jgi:type IV pilus assembly protein PilM